jgi:hypothetical protein
MFLFWSAGLLAFFKGSSCHPLYSDGNIGMPAAVRARDFEQKHRTGKGVLNRNQS